MENNIEVVNGIYLIKDDSHFTKWFKNDWGKTIRFPFSSHINSGMCVIDIGANVGLYSRAIEDIIGESGQLYSFEPMPLAFYCLCRNVKLPKTKVFPLGLSDYCCKERLYISQPNYGASFISSRSNNYSLNPNNEDDLEIALVSLDSIMGMISAVDVIKIDAEGFEPFILKGATNLIMRDRPKLIIESNRIMLRRQSETPERLIEIIKSLNYSITGFTGADQEDIVCVPQ